MSGERLGHRTLVDPPPGGLDQVRNEERAGADGGCAEGMPGDVRFVGIDQGRPHLTRALAQPRRLVDARRRDGRPDARVGVVEQ